MVNYLIALQWYNLQSSLNIDRMDQQLIFPILFPSSMLVACACANNPQLIPLHVDQLISAYTCIYYLQTQYRTSQCARNQFSLTEQVMPKKMIFIYIRFPIVVIILNISLYLNSTAVFNETLSLQTADLGDYRWKSCMSMD